MNITLYTTGCPRCKILKKKLADNGIAFSECTDTDTMVGMGLTSVPVLSVDGTLYEYMDALKWVNNKKGENE